MSRGTCFLISTLVIFLAALAIARVLDAARLIRPRVFECQQITEALHTLEQRFLKTANPLIAGSDLPLGQQADAAMIDFDQQASKILAELNRSVDPQDPLLRGMQDNLAGLLNRHRILKRQYEAAVLECRSAEQGLFARLVPQLFGSGEYSCPRRADHEA